MTRNAAERGLPCVAFYLTLEQNRNISDTEQIQEMMMTEFVQDVVSLVSMSAFVTAVAVLIGSL